MNRFVIRLYASALDRFARTGKVQAVERTIAMIVRLIEKQPQQWVEALQRFSSDPRWILRYLAGREIERLLVHDPVLAADTALRLAGDPSLYVREGIAKGIVQSAEARFDQVWPFWQKAFDDPSDEVRQTAAMTLIALLKLPELTGRLQLEAEKIRRDRSVKVKAVFDNYVAPLLEERSPADALRCGYATTADIPVPEKTIDRVVGQDEAVSVIRLAALQRRSVLLIGEPGTGKSMLGQAMAEMLHGTPPTDVLAEPGTRESSVPAIRLLPAGEGERVIRAHERAHRSNAASLRWILGFAAFTGLFVAVFYSFTRDNPVYMLIGLSSLFVLYWFGKTLKVSRSTKTPKYLINRTGNDNPPFIDATGLHAGALLGDIRHDPYQSGGMETSPHHLVEPGAIHLADQGVLYIDEVSTLSIESQQALLTAFQDKKMAITGRTPGSSGRMIRTEPVPSDFIMVLAGNMQDVESIHPALRSRIRGYGYEVYLNETMPDTAENRFKLVQFVAQEVQRDGKIPHFTAAAVNEVIRRAGQRADRAGHLTSRFRELGGLIRAAGDAAVQSGSELVHAEHVWKALQAAMSLEQQIGLRKYGSLELLRADSCCGRVKAFDGGRDAFGTMVQCWTDFQPSAAVEIKSSDGGAGGKSELLPVEAVLNRYALPGTYFIEIEGAEPDGSFNHYTLAIALSALSAAHGRTWPEHTAVCGTINVLGLVKEIRHFDTAAAAARHLGIRTLIAPAGNRRTELPDGLRFIWVHSIEEAWQAVQSQAAAVELC
ncbi:AAA family ATPase [Paenibacillus sp. N4]|uniref:ATP-binding protein n=1 Tax=Paenibacillus vietnamensis TaxID=2590547 RepID=UPI001CD06FD1|nr:ATP-binding protein [Paenibacillus vietnamensis]MCA0757667.1 AAA family ATPase [Paenibacillus vietnamensis]